MFLILILGLQLFVMLVIGLVFYRIRKNADEWQKTSPTFTGNIEDDCPITPGTTTWFLLNDD